MAAIRGKCSRCISGVLRPKRAFERRLLSKRTPKKRDKNWIQRALDRDHTARRFWNIPGFERKSFDVVWVMVFSSGLAVVCMDPSDPVMGRAFQAVVPTYGKIEEGSYFSVLGSAWFPVMDTPFLGIHWMIGLGLGLACRASASQIALLYTISGAAGAMTQYAWLKSKSEEKGWTQEELKNIRINGADPAIQGLKGAVIANWIETIRTFYPAPPNMIHNVAAAVSVYTLLYFATDLFPRRKNMLELRGVKENSYTRSLLWGDQAGALAGFLAFTILGRARRLRPPRIV